MKNGVAISKKNDATSYVPELGNRRIISFGIDWILGGVFAGIPAVTSYAILTGKSSPLTSMYQFEAAEVDRLTTVAILFLCLLFGFFYYVIVPWKLMPGQTVGKKLMHLRIVSSDAENISFKRYFVRQFIFLIGIEGIATPVSTYLRVIITTITRTYVDSYIGIIWDLITIGSVFMMFWGSKHLSLHDRMTKTTVIAEES